MDTIPVLKTKRLYLTPSSESEIQKLLEATGDVSLKQTYSHMLEACRINPEQQGWYVPWRMMLKDKPEETIGAIGFGGPPSEGCVSIGCGVNSEHEDNRYATEAARKMIAWAFSDKSVYIVKAETLPDNEASVRLLKRLKFEKVGSSGKNQSFILKRPRTEWPTILIACGMSVGMLAGMLTGQMLICMAVGMLTGLIAGRIFDNREKDRVDTCLAALRGTDMDSE